MYRGGKCELRKRKKLVAATVTSTLRFFRGLRHAVAVENAVRNILADLRLNSHAEGMKMSAFFAEWEREPSR